MKITIIGAGNVGSTCAAILAQKNIVQEIVLIDIKKGIAEGKALDIYQSSSIMRYSTNIIGVTDDYSKTSLSNIIVITSGFPRNPGMTRDDVIKLNLKIVENVTKKAIKYSPNAILIVVSNPLDIMTYVALKASKIKSCKVIGMAGILDTARYKTFISNQIDCSSNEIQALLLGGHGDTMVPLIRYTTISGIPIKEIISEDKLKNILERTKNGGGEIVDFLGVSAWHTPAASIVQIIEAIVKNSKNIYTCSVLLQGEYGFKNICIGVPVILGKNGIEKIIELKLNKEEKKMLSISAEHINKMLIKNIKI